MEHNPYSPPQTEVREPATPELAGPRPIQVTWAVRLLWVDFALSVLEMALAARKQYDPGWFILALVMAAAIVAAEAFVIYKLGARRNWARYVTLAATVLGVADWLNSIKGGLAADVTSVLIDAISLVADGVALFLIFSSPGKHWFKKRPAS